MDKTALRNFFRPVIVVFILINALCLGFAKWLDDKGINHEVLIWANLLLFIITLIACYIHVRSVTNSNPHAFVRGVTLASFMKLMVIAISVFIYLLAAGENRSVYAVIVSMGLYIIYTIFEVKGAMKLNGDQNAKN
jgi:hypothetical protein